jgi:hypothetical protein
MENAGKAENIPYSSLGKGEVESSILSCSTIPPALLSSVRQRLKNRLTDKV